MDHHRPIAAPPAPFETRRDEQPPMTKQVLLNNIDHQALKVAPRFGAAFGDSVNQLPVFPTEFEALQREYPIFFRRDEQGVLHAVVMLGLDRNENLFLAEQGWDAHYIPAIQRRGPFSIGIQERDEGGERRREPMIHVDLDDPRIGTQDGFPLFLPHGGNAPYLEHIADALKAIYDGMERAGPMYQLLDELGLVQPVAVEIEIDEGTRYAVPQYHSVSAERLAALDGAALERLHRAGYLADTIFALSSLANVQRLIERKNLKRRAAPA
jgi:hypothetical protein